MNRLAFWDPCRHGAEDSCGSSPGDLLFETVVAIGTGRAEVVVVSEVVP
jgi:hypothetical protein